MLFIVSSPGVRAGYAPGAAEASGMNGDAGARVAARRLIIVCLSLLVLIVLDGPDLRRGLGHPLGSFGIDVNFSTGTVIGVASNAAAAGVRLGDRVELSHARGLLTPMISFGTPDAGEAVMVPLVRDGRRIHAVVTTAAESSSSVDAAMLRELVGALSAVLGTLVLLRRPSTATWGFFFLMLIGCGPSNDVYLIGAGSWPSVAPLVYIASVSSGIVPQWGAIFFALHLLRAGPLPRWRRVAHWLAVAGTVAAGILAIASAGTYVYGSSPNGLLRTAASFFGTLPLFCAPLVLAATYVESKPDLRARLRWIIGGFSVALVCNVVDQLGSAGNLGVIQMSYQVHSLLVCAIYVSIGLPVAYAVLKHHVIDVNVAVSRATVYTILSIAVVGVFALVDLFFTRALAAKNAGLIADMGLALILGFSFNTLHRHIDSFVDRILFKRRHIAEEHVARVTVAMRYAHSEAHVESMLLEEPKRAFGISGACLLSETQRKARDAETLASYLEGARTAVRLTTSQWNLAALDASWIPAVAIPIFSHNALDAIIIYAMHADGTDLDTQEVALLERLCDAAGSALDRLEAERLRAENAALRNREGQSEPAPAL